MSEIDIFLNNTLSAFNTTFLYPFANHSVHTFIEEYTPKANISFLSSVLCNDRGFFKPNLTSICQCDLGYFELYCKSNGIKYWRRGWTVFRIIFGICYGILSLATWYYYIRKLIDEGKCTKMLFRLFIVPKYLIMENLIIISNTRFFFIIIDPFAQLGRINYQASRVLYELIYGSLVAFLISILIIWIGVYTSFKMDLNPLTNLKLIKKRDSKAQCCNCNYQCVKIICIFLLVIVFPLQMFSSYFICDRDTPNKLDSIIYIIVSVVLVVIGFTLYYTITLKSTLNKKYRSNALSEQIEVKVIYNYGSHESDDKRNYKGNTFKTLTDKDIIDFLEEMYQKNYIDLVNNCIIDNKDKDKGLKFKRSNIANSANDFDNDNNNNDYDDEDDVLDKLDIENEKKYFDDTELLEIYSKKNSEYYLQSKKDSQREDSEHDVLQAKNHDNSSSTKNNNIHNKLSRVNYKGDKSSIELMELTEVDMKNLDLIFKTSYFIISAILIVFVIVIIVGFNIQTNKPSFVISVIVIQFIFELSSFYAIFYLFVRDIKTQEYENLKSIAEIENFHKRKEDNNEKGLLYFKGISLTEVWGRFKSYITLHKIDTKDDDNIE